MGGRWEEEGKEMGRRWEGDSILLYNIKIIFYLYKKTLDIWKTIYYLCIVKYNYYYSL